MLYVEKIENHKIGNNTPFADVAVSLGWTLTIDENDTEKAYDGSLWEKGYAPEKPVEELQAEVRKVRNGYLEKYVDPKQLVLVWDGLSIDERNTYAEYRKYLLDYTNSDGWWLANPMTFDEWLEPKPEEPVDGNELEDNPIEESITGE